MSLDSIAASPSLGEIILILASLAPFYLLGAFPTGYLVARAQGVAIEEHGSGNVGATNVLRTLGKKAGAVTFAGDFMKGLLAALLGSAIGGPGFGLYAGAAAVCGHCFSIPGKLKGGKGVATAFGVFTFSSPIVALVALVSFALTLRLGRMVSLASIVAALVAPLVAVLTGIPNAMLLPLGGIGLLVVWRHRSNIQRIIEGREPKTGAPRTSHTDAAKPL